MYPDVLEGYIQTAKCGAQTWCFSIEFQDNVRLFSGISMHCDLYSIDLQPAGWFFLGFDSKIRLCQFRAIQGSCLPCLWLWLKANPLQKLLALHYPKIGLGIHKGPNPLHRIPLPSEASRFVHHSTETVTWISQNQNHGLFWTVHPVILGWRHNISSSPLIWNTNHKKVSFELNHMQQNLLKGYTAIKEVQLGNVLVGSGFLN